MHVVIPTRFDRHTLWPLVNTILEVGTPVIVHTEPGHPNVDQCINVHDYSPSIQSWWNSGLDHTGDRALVLNDDIEATPASLTTLHTELDNNDVVYLAGHRVGHATPLTGWCYGIRHNIIRPDNAYGWWYGDDDLYRRAVRDGLRISALNIPEIRHIRQPAAFSNPVHAAMVEQDAKTYAERWP